MAYKQFVCLSGMPRAGSTLLSAILSQNPNIHAEGNSSVCQLMWDMQQSCLTYAREQLEANNRQSTRFDLVSAVPRIYYDNCIKPIVLDKCRSWTMPNNHDMLRRYITETPKIIILERPLIEVISSFVFLARANGVVCNFDNLDNLEKGPLRDFWEPMINSFIGVQWAKQNNNGDYLFITYNDLVNNPATEIDKIYSFCGWQPYKHVFNDIVNIHPENDAVYGLLGMHDIRKNIQRRVVDVVLPPSVIEYCEKLKHVQVVKAHE